MPPLNSVSKSCIALAIGQCLAVPALTHAANITVNSNTDDGTGCTLREAIVSANTTVDQNNGCANGSNSGTDTITFSNSLPSNTITLANGELIVVSSIEINANSVSGGITIDANSLSRVLNAESATLTMDHITLTGGSSVSGGGGLRIADSVAAIRNSRISGNITSGGEGGGIYARNNYSVTLNNSIVSNNTATRFAGGGISTSNTNLTINDSTIDNNEARVGGGLNLRTGSNIEINTSTISGNTSPGDNNSIATGGGVRAFGVENLTLNDSEVSRNSANQTGGVYLQNISRTEFSNSRVSNNVSTGYSKNGAGVYSKNTPLLYFTNSTINHNVSQNGGGGIYAKNSDLFLTDSRVSGNSAGRRGAGVQVNTSTLDVTRTVIAENRTLLSGSGSGNAGAGVHATQESLVTLTNTTISGNSGATSQVFAIALSGESSFSANHTTIANNAKGINVSAFARSSLNNSIVANLASGADCRGRIDTDAATIIQDGTCSAMRSGDPGLLPLNDNGGTSRTHALANTSIARNSSFDLCQDTDQRGKTRDTSDGACDVGAFEFIEGKDGQDNSGFFVVPLKNGKTVIFEL